jgi:hypothetical protein
MRIPVLATLLLTLAVPALAEDSPTPAADTSALPAAASGLPAPMAGSDGVPDLPKGTVYLLQEVQLTGSEFSEAILLVERSITTFEDCEKARETARSAEWPAYHPQLRNYKGLPSRVEYRCVVAEQKLSAFRYKAPLEFYYLLRISDDNQLKLEHFKDYFSCRNVLGPRKDDRFCARMSQHVVE